MDLYFCKTKHKTMKNKIAITGDLGSGKSSVCKILHEKLNFRIVSVGSIQRELAANHNMSITEFNRYMETHPEIDIACDNKVSEWGRSDEGLIFDSRLAWHFVPHALKVYLKVDILIAAQRIFGDRERKNEEQSDIDAVQSKISERRQSEILRFKSQYRVDLESFDNYDVVIDTGNLSIEETADIILEVYACFATGKPFAKFHPADTQR